MTESTLCPKFHKAVELFSKRWNALIINQLLSGSQRFCNLNASMPISGQTLIRKIKRIRERRNCYKRGFPEVPVRVEYTLTEKGLALKNVLQEIDVWSKKWIQIEDLGKKG